MKKLAIIGSLGIICPILTLLTGCSKDTDLLAEAVITDQEYSSFESKVVLNDFYLVKADEPIVLDVLSNDGIEDIKEAQITNTSEPENGTVVVNEDKTITYIPDTGQAQPEELSNDAPEDVAESDSQGDSFQYTVETTDSNGNKKSEEATVQIVYEYGELKAFPGAEGYGKYTSGGRGGYVVHVTNLNDSGSGSLRDAIENKKGSRTVVFDVSGIIQLSNSLKIRSGYGNVTIAGQTAPEGGITLAGASVWIQDSNVIMRYVSVRPGKDWHPNGQDPSDENYEPDDAFRIIAFNGSHLENIILDHCTISWGRDGLLDITTVGNNASVKNVTIQNTILSENVDKGYATLISGNVDNVTYYKNFIAHCSTRNIAMNALDGDVEFFNNIVYGLRRGAWVKYSCRANMIGNSYFTNPNNPRTSETLRLETNNGASPENTKVYLEDNRDDNKSITYNSRMQEYLQSSPNQGSGIAAVSSGQLNSFVLEGVGNSIYRDDTDSRVIQQFSNLSGKFIKHEDEVGGFPLIESQKHPKNYDSDNDGMPDFWEEKNNDISSQNADGDTDFNDDGFTNLEDYLHSLTLK